MARRNTNHYRQMFLAKYSEITDYFLAEFTEFTDKALVPTVLPPKCKSEQNLIPGPGRSQTSGGARGPRPRSEGQRGRAAVWWPRGRGRRGRPGARGGAACSGSAPASRLGSGSSAHSPPALS